MPASMNARDFTKLFAPKYLLSFASLLVLVIAKPFVAQYEWVSFLAVFFLGVAILSAVHHAEVIAHRIGEGLGTLVLALCVTVIEVGLILSLMGQAGADGNFLARDTIFAAVMIITNGMVGLCLILGGLKYGEQKFQVHGSRSLLVVLVTLSILVFILPNYTTTTVGGTFSGAQLIFTAVVCVLLYLIFIFFQTRTHRAYFETVATAPDLVSAEGTVASPDVTALDAVFSFGALCVSLIAVIGLAKVISPLLERAVDSVGAPKAVVGLIIATIVLIPEIWAAVNAARSDRLQTSLNLALGSGIASIALTIPAVIVYSLTKNQELVLGLDPKNTVFLAMTVTVANLTLGAGKTTVLQGAVHVVILLTYFITTLIP